MAIRSHWLSHLAAAIAVRVVTPDPLLPVSGGVGASNPVGKKEGELTVRALVLADEATRVAIVSADFLGFPAVLGNKADVQVSGIATAAGNVTRTSPNFTLSVVKK